MTGFVFWKEPGLDGDIQRSVSVDEAIRLQREFMSNTNRNIYGPDEIGDEAALRDFIIINRAFVGPDCVHHDPIFWSCTIGRKAPGECRSCAAKLPSNHRVYGPQE